MLQSLLCPMFRQKHVCKGCSPVTNSEACLYPHSFIQHQQHVANNHKNASYLPRQRDFSCLSLELGTAVTAPDSSCVLHTAQFEFHIMEAFVMVPFSWVRQIHEQHTKSWCGSPWRGIRLTGGKQPHCPHHNVTPKDGCRHWKALIGSNAKDLQEAVLQSWCMLSIICIHTVNRKAYNQFLLLYFLLFICSTETVCHPQKRPGFHCAERCTERKKKGGSYLQMLLI